MVKIMRSLILTFILLIPFASQAQGEMRTMLYEVIKNGESTGVIDPSIERMFNQITKGKNPIALKLKLIKKYKGECGLIEFNFTQNNAGIMKPEVLTANGDFNFWFHAPMCVNGQIPKEAEQDIAERRTLQMSRCQINIAHGQPKDGVIEGTTTFKGCPAGGHVQIVYQGNCTALKMKDGEFIQFDFDAEGAANVKMSVPNMCLTNKKKPPVWHYRIYYGTNVANEILIGETDRSW